jgi:hypothetical protein
MEKSMKRFVSKSVPACFQCFWVSFATIVLAPLSLGAGESWPQALAKMPLNSKVLELNRTNCVRVMLGSFQESETVKALIFMPGATDEFYMFRRAKALISGERASLLDAIAALTNQTLIRVSFRAPLLLLHTDEDPLEPIAHFEHEATVRKLQRAVFPKYLIWNDRDWDYVQPILKKRFRVDVRPWRRSYDSWHFYRHSFAGWNLTGWETLQAVALAGKTSFTIQRGGVLFEGDERIRARQSLKPFPDSGASLGDLF